MSSRKGEIFDEICRGNRARYNAGSWCCFFGGAFEADVEVKMNEGVKKDVIELTTDTIEKTKKSADEVLIKLQKKVSEQVKE